MHWLFCYVMQQSFDLPILAFQDTIEKELVKEIDFKNEATNAEICRKNFLEAGRKNVYIPKIHTEYTSQRTLVLEWIDGIKITHGEELRAQGFNVTEAIQVTVEAFAEQIFVSGFLHADPHPGNVFVR